MEQLEHMTLAELLIKHPSLALTCNDFSIDYIHYYDWSLEELCAHRPDIDCILLKRAIELNTLKKDLNLPGVEEWPFDFVVQFIENVHHNYLKKQLPILTKQGAREYKILIKTHPELISFKETFNQLGTSLLRKIHREQHVLFPALLELSVEGKIESSIGEISSPISVIQQDHKYLSGLLMSLENVIKNHEKSALNFALKLKLFIHYLKQHMALENHFLFPKALELQKKINQ